MICPDIRLIGCKDDFEALVVALVAQHATEEEIKF
jgi:hypothetical protein|tara:strand:- start:80 stop:184 length:105 start_codon:yes stop_codon:yes gene_type:complete